MFQPTYNLFFVDTQMLIDILSTQKFEFAATTFGLYLF